MPDQLHPVQQLFLAMEMLPMEEHASNNNNQNTLWQLRDRLFQVLFERATIAYASTFPARFRKLIEIGLLVLAVICLFILMYAHVAFVRTPVNCLEKEIQTWSREGVLRIEISLEEPIKKNYNISIYYNNTLASHFSRIRQEQKNYLELMKSKKAQQRPVNKVPEVPAENFEAEILDAEKSPIFINRTIPFKDSVSDPDCFSPFKATLSDTELFTNTGVCMHMSATHVDPLQQTATFPILALWHQDKYVIEYSLEYGFLRLSPGARQNTSVKVHTVVLDPCNDECFGNEFSRFLLKYILGYSDILMGSLRYLVDRDEYKGFVRNVVTGDQYRFVDKSTTWTAYLSAAFFMIIFTLSVSMLLRYSHHQIFLFVVELLHVFEMNTISFPAAPLLTVVLALVGMEAIMSEFFNDSVTAFYIIIIVWMADQYDSICCRTAVSKKHWLRLFYLYHFGFYAYHYRFNGQYSFLALVTSWLFIQHSMVYFFHRYELPSIWVANENDTDYDSDASYSVDNYIAAQDAALMDDDEGSIVQEASAPSQESSLQDTLPTTSLVSGSDNSHSQSTNPVANKKEMNGAKENKSAVSSSSHVIA